MSVSNVSQRNGLASMKSSGLLLLHLLPSQLSNPNNHSLLLFFPQKPQQLTAANSLSVHILSQPLHLCRSSKWDPNVESIKNQNFIKFGDFENEEEEEFDRDEILDQGAQVLEEYIDSIWIFKVFWSYGWALPPILIALLITGGPKAFLMALAIPLGQSTFSFAIQKMLDATQNKPRRKSRTKKRQRASASNKTNFGRRGGSPRTRKRKPGYQTWASTNGVSANKDEPEVSRCGGWDELDQVSESISTGAFESSAQSSVGTSKIPVEKGNLSKPEAKSDTPLLLRLLIAISPFSAS
ncbi:PREDICTED: uncharacterized protein LOC109229399 [Nicotiana attenuata]|uniref:Uncharacterized protein n=1 Tax=Nicotiana attenuata TaxID=49451 RepID=A0A1J6I7P2_NICAT|nr:PREDICTED: uncharacterized protein LOC109229399 [Nicotiana attenuata]OIT01030.1 hypothetical protein A4A49_02580 [Nicotiana attenuata]